MSDLLLITLTIVGGLVMIVFFLCFFAAKIIEREECRRERNEYNPQEMHSNEKVINSNEIKNIFDEYISNAKKRTRRGSTPELDSLDNE